jgi:hypothetical protein
MSALPLALTGGFNIALARFYGQRREIAGAALVGATMDLAGDYVAVLDTAPAPTIPARSVLARLTGVEADQLTIDTRNLDWFTPKFRGTNLALIGGAGSGKSIIARHVTDCIVQGGGALGLELIFGLLSTHYESNPENPLNRWFPGIPPEDLEGLICRTKEDCWQRLLAFETLMGKRMQAEATTAPLRYLIIDDYQYQFPKEKQQQAAAIIERIVDEARKYNLRLILVLHSLKGKQNAIDSSVLWSMTAVIFQSALADPNMKSLWPSDIVSQGVGNLAETLSGEARVLGGQWKVALIRPGSLDCGWDGAQVKLLPDRSESGVTFDMEDRPWIDAVTEDLLTQVQSGKVSSVTAAMRYAGVTRRHKNKDGSYVDPKAQAVWDWWQESFGTVEAEAEVVNQEVE